MTDETAAAYRAFASSKNTLAKIKKRLPNGLQFFKKNYRARDYHTSNEQGGLIEETMVPRRSSCTKSAEVWETFHQNLEQQRFAVAGQQLISREERLFALKQDGVGTNRRLLEEENNEEENLKKDFEDLIQQVLSVVRDSLNCKTAEKKKILKEAVQALQQEEEQDRRWEGLEHTERPQWRPRCLRQSHDSLLQKMVLHRMEEAQLDSNSNMSSVQREMTAKGKQLQKDLLTVAEHVKDCYPGENVCQLYASLYHQAFRNKIKEITDFELGDDDSLQVLLWVNDLYPGILSKEELNGFIEYDQFKPLLPDNTLKSLEEQVLEGRKTELLEWTSNALSTEKNHNPDLEDDGYFSPLAIDVITCTDNVLTLLEKVMGSKTKALRIADCIEIFLKSYKQFLEGYTEGDQLNTDAVLKANLFCIRQFREYIGKKDFPEHIKTKCFDLLSHITDNCHDFFIKPIQKDLKQLYCKLGTREWLKQNEDEVCHDLLDGLKRHIQKLKNLKMSCLEELVGQLHEEVLVEYVKKMMKKKIKLANEKKQSHAYKLLCVSSQKIHSLFTKAGSKMDWLKEILPALAEVLILKDPHCIELQLVTLSRTYPGFSEAHMYAWLYLKADLKASDLKKIKKAFNDFQEPEILEITAGDEDQCPDNARNRFFSKVVIK